MARKFIDGFESGGDDLWDVENNATVISSAGLDMDGDYCLDLTDSGDYVQKDIAAVGEMYFAMLWRYTHEDSIGIISFLNGTTHLCNVQRTVATDIVRIIRGTTVLASGTEVLTVDTTYLIEVRFLIDDTNGRFVVKIDGVTDIDFTGDTKQLAFTQFDKVKLGIDSLLNQSYSYYDNFIMDDAAWIGDTKIQAVVPTGAGATTGWTPSAGANWECVDEKPASDADYVSIDAIDTVDTYAAENLAGTIGAVKCVQVQSRMRTDGSPTPTNVKLVVRSGAADYLSGDKSVLVAEKGLWNLWELNPADAAAWEEADVNGMEIGIRSAA